MKKRRMNHSSRLLELFVKAGLLAAVAAALLLPTTIKVNGSEAMRCLDNAWPEPGSAKELLLPHILSLETTARTAADLERFQDRHADRADFDLLWPELAEREKGGPRSSVQSSHLNLQAAAGGSSCE